MQNRAHAVLRHAGLERQQRAQLRVAVLLDDELQLVRVEKLLHLLAEREAAHPHVVEPDALRAEARRSPRAPAVAAPSVTMPDSLPAPASITRLRHQARGRQPLLAQPIDHHLVLARVLGVGTVLVVAGTAGEVRALGMTPGIVRYGMPSSSWS